MNRHHAAAAALLALAACGRLATGDTAAGPAEAAPDSIVHTEVTVARVAHDRWQVDYRFSRPVDGFALGPVAAQYRSEAWTPATAGVRLVQRDGEELLVADTALRHLRVHVRRYTRFVHDQYAPMLPFTDGGVALYAGFFTGDALIGGEPAPTQLSLEYVPLPGERVLTPAGGSADGYAYFGTQDPVQAPHARLVIDSGTPAWLRTAMHDVITRTNTVFADRLGAEPPMQPLILVGAGDIDSADGLSVKGGAVGDQLVMLLTGRGLREETPPRRAALERLTAHELAHLWQLRGFPNAFNHGEPWLHEAGIWDSAQVRAFAERAATQCQTTLDGRTLAAAVHAGAFDAAYSCGFGLFWDAADPDPIGLWERLARAVTANGASFESMLLDRVRAAGG